jgi:glutamate-1-semialdehyde 2,1-aminomutase/spore coat polysaccharide biosynthesis protein SpsF
MKIVAICQARMGSTRVPGKVMRQLSNKPVLRWAYDNIRCSAFIDEVVIATSTDHRDDVIQQYCNENKIECFRGSETDVLDRYYWCAKQYQADIVLRFTCDCPFIDPGIINEVIKLREMMDASYASNCYPPTYPDGLDTECFTFAALESAWKEATSPVDRDCLTQFIVRNRSRFKVVNLTCPLPGLDRERWVLDTEKDWEFCKAVATKCAHTGASYVYIRNFLDNYPNIRELNAGGIRNERFYEALSEERLSPRTFTESARVFNRAIKTIPTGAQTFSKSHIQFPEGRSPLYANYGDGGYIFDVDGSRYVDLVGALYPVILGYNDPDVNESIRRQLDNGISFSLATELESELSELLCKHIPCAEMVKLGKSGTDVTTAAVRLARAYTGREHILLGGYHGWSDWSISSTDRRAGIPEDVRTLTTRISSKKINSLPYNFMHPYVMDEVAAIIVEPIDDPEYLDWLRVTCDKHGIVLIFDEIITGFRHDMGGAQALYGVTPDLACFGKAMANGMPISALVGKRNIMEKMNSPDVFYSGTFFGETLSIAAAIATIKKIERENVCDYLCKMGARLERHILASLKHTGISDYILIDGWYPNQHLTFLNNHIRSLFMMEMAQQGVLIIASNALSFAHKEPEFKRICTAYDNTFRVISDCLQRGDISRVVGDSVVEATPLRATA